MSTDTVLTSAAPDARSGRLRVGPSRLSGPLRNAISIVAIWVLLIIATTLVRPDFLSLQTVLAVTFTMAITGILAVGQAFVVISGGLLDLSIPVSIILSAFVVVTSLGAGLPDAVAILLGLLAGAAWGALNATIIVYGKLNPIIVTLATGFAGLAIMLILFQSAQIPAASGLREFGLGKTLGLPNVFLPMVAIVLIAGLLVANTRWGRRLVAVGGNSVAAKSRGISLKKTRYGAFIASGTFAGIAGVMFCSVQPQFGPASGADFQLTVIAAVILAGISLSGGTGNFAVLLLSIGFLSTIPTSLAFFGFPPAFTQVFQGAVLIAAVGIDGFRQKLGKR